jgi:hypothetical protein
VKVSSNHDFLSLSQNSGQALQPGI